MGPQELHPCIPQPRLGGSGSGGVRVYTKDPPVPAILISELLTSAAACPLPTDSCSCWWVPRASCPSWLPFLPFPPLYTFLLSLQHSDQKGEPQPFAAQELRHDEQYRCPSGPFPRLMPPSLLAFSSVASLTVIPALSGCLDGRGPK